MTQIVLAFPNESSAKANKLASSLEQAIASRGAAESVVRVREDDSSMDAGTLLAIVLGAPSVISLVTSIKEWSLRNYRGTIEISREGTSIKIENVAIKDVDQLAQALAPLFENDN